MPSFRFRKRRRTVSPNKNALKVARETTEQRKVNQAETLREQFPNAGRLAISWQMKTRTGALLAESRRDVEIDQPLLLDVDCEGGCGDGVFLLTEAVKNALRAQTEKHAGNGVCQAVSYNNPTAPCGTILEYQISAAYK